MLVIARLPAKAPPPVGVNETSTSTVSWGAPFGWMQSSPSHVAAGGHVPPPTQSAEARKRLSQVGGIDDVRTANAPAPEGTTSSITSTEFSVPVFLR